MISRSLADQARYLRRLGLQAEPPSVDALFRLQRAHVERVPWETLWIHEGRSWGIDAGQSAARVATTTRGGYCFHLNGAFSELLGSLGYSVARHVGGVHGSGGPSPAEMTNHLVLTVGDLSTEANPGGRWYVDVGLGDALHEPLPVAPGAVRQGPFVISLEAVNDGLGDWHLTHDPEGSFVGMSWSASPTAMAAFEQRHERLATAPDSTFVRSLVVQRRDADGADMLLDRLLRRVGTGAFERELGSRDELDAALGDVFGIGVTGSKAERDAQWQRVSVAHAERQSKSESTTT